MEFDSLMLVHVTVTFRTRTVFLREAWKSNKFKFVSTMSSFPWLRFTAAAIGCAFSLARLNHLEASSSNLPLCMCYHGTPLLSYSPADLATFHINLVLIASACDSFACLRLYSDGYWIRDDERFVSLPA
jgi:hypothetical protein